MDYLERISRPHPGLVNQGLTSPPPKLMGSLLGEPRESYTGACQEPTNPLFIRHLVAQDVGPFRARGIKPAVHSLDLILAQVKAELPELHALVGDAGMLCCRYRHIGGKAVPPASNHSWGTAIDLKLGGRTDVQGDDLCFRGLSILAKYFNAARWFWGSTFPTEDSMHFEASAELMRDWKRAGLI